MRTFDASTEEDIRPYTEGLWGDVATVQQTLAALERALTRDLMINDNSGAALLRAGEIAAARKDMPSPVRASVLRTLLGLQLEWMESPLISRTIAYPLLSTIALDAELPEELRREAQARLEAEAERCTKHLLLKQSEPPPWGESADAPAPEDALLDRLGLLPPLYDAIVLIDEPVLVETWRPTLIRLVTVEAGALVNDLERDDSFGGQLLGYYVLGKLLTCAWLEDPTRSDVQAIYDHFVDDQLQLIRRPGEAMDEDTFRYATTIRGWPSLKPEAREELNAYHAANWQRFVEPESEQ